MTAGRDTMGALKRRNSMRNFGKDIITWKNEVKNKTKDTMAFPSHENMVIDSFETCCRTS